MFSQWNSRLFIALTMRNLNNFLILAILLIAANVKISRAVPCHEMDDSMAWKTCEYNSTFDFIGNREVNKHLHFGDAKENEINDFFAKITKPDTTLVAGIDLRDNPNIEYFSFGSKIKKWECREYIKITNNLKLKKIELSTPTGSVDYLEIYNNPLIDPHTFGDLWKSVNSKNPPYFQQEQYECIFMPPGSTAYAVQSQEFLNLCKIIRGDVILKDLTISQEVTIEGNGCLKLENVDLTKGKLKFNNTLLKQCRVNQIDGRHDNYKSTIIKNPGICGNDLMELGESFDVISSEIPIEVDINSCSKVCDTSDTFHKYIACKEIITTVDISPWFTDPKLQYKEEHLISAKGTLIIENTSVSKISLLKLETVKKLIIRNNPNLEAIDLPKLKSVTLMTITGNPKIGPGNLKIPTAAVSNLSWIECYTNENTEITNMAELNLCATIMGPLKFTDNSQLTSLFLPNLTAVTELVISNNPKLTTITLPKLKLDSFITIAGNPKIKPENLAILHETIGHMTRIECYTDDNTQITAKFQNETGMNGCTTIKGPLNLDGWHSKTAENLILREIDGCITMTNRTNRTVMFEPADFDFLDEIIIENCAGKHQLLHSEYLCPPLWFREEGDIKIGEKRDCTHNPCDSLDDVKLNRNLCKKFIGILTVDDTIDEKRLSRLEKIEGQLIIEGLTRNKISIPKLENIKGGNEIPIIIQNNPNLEDVKITKYFPRIITKETVHVKILGNPKLLKVDNIMNPYTVEQCSGFRTDRQCFYDNSLLVKFPKIDPPFWEEPWYWPSFVIWFSVILAMTITYIYFGYYYDDELEEVQAVKKKKKNKKKQSTLTMTTMAATTTTTTMTGEDPPSINVQKIIEEEEKGPQSMCTTAKSIKKDPKIGDEPTVDNEESGVDSTKSQSIILQTASEGRSKIATALMKTTGISSKMPKGIQPAEKHQVIYPSTFAKFLEEEKAGAIMFPTRFKDLCDQFLSKEPLYYRKKFLEGQPDQEYKKFGFRKNIHLIASAQTESLYALALFNIVSPVFTNLGESAEEIHSSLLFIGNETFPKCFKEFETDDYKKKDYFKDFDLQVCSHPPSSDNNVTKYVMKSATIWKEIQDKVKIERRLKFQGHLEVTTSTMSRILKGNLTEAANLPWYEYLHVAYEKKIPIQTNIPEYFTAIYFFYYALDRTRTNDQLPDNLAEEAYFRIRDAYCGQRQHLVDSFYLWYYVTLKKMIEDERILETVSADKKQQFIQKATEHMRAIEEMDKRLQETNGKQINWGHVDGTEFIETVDKRPLSLQIRGFYLPAETPDNDELPKVKSTKTAKEKPKKAKKVHIPGMRKSSSNESVGGSKKMPSTGELSAQRKATSTGGDVRKMPSAGAHSTVRKFPSAGPHSTGRKAPSTPSVGGTRKMPSTGENSAQRKAPSGVRQFPSTGKSKEA